MSRQDNDFVVDDVYVLGDNAWGQLSPHKDKFYVKPGHLDSELRKEFFGTENVVYICGGGEFNLMLTAAGHVYGMGTTVEGVLGHELESEKFVKIPLMVKEYSAYGPVRNIACGFAHTIIVTEDHRVFTLGRNQEYQLGDNSTTSRSVLSEITQNFNLTENEHIVEVCCGSWHTIVRTNFYRVFYFGTTGDSVQITPKLLETNNVDIIKLSAGQNFSLLLDMESKLWLHYNDQLTLISDALVSHFSACGQLYGIVFQTGKVKLFDILEQDVLFYCCDDTHTFVDSISDAVRVYATSSSILVVAKDHVHMYMPHEFGEGSFYLEEFNKMLKNGTKKSTYAFCGHNLWLMTLV